MEKALNNQPDNVELVLKSRMPHLKRTEKQIAQFILSDAALAATLTISELSKSSGASTASVSRLCTKFGFDSFKQFQLALAKSISSTAREPEDELFSDDAPAEVIRKVFALNKISLEETERILDKAALIKAARLISRAPKVVFFGLGGSAAIAKDAEIHLSHLGVNAYSYSDPYQMVIAAIGLKRGDVAIGISHSGQTRNAIESISMAGQSKAATIAITNYIDSPLAKAADIVLLTSYKEREIRSAKSSSRIAQLCILDCIYFIVARIKAGTAKPIVDRIEKEVKTSIRVF